MRFNKIQIPSYGPFTGLKIELPKTGGDFHLFYGPNEAGKSSLLRSLRAMLFGIHGQTTDNFIHDYSQMRILAELEKRDGSIRIFQRRKGNKNTLLDETDAAILESELRDFLGGVDESYFDSMFGLGSDELRQGADALLRGEGRLGEALFSASLGGTPVDKVIESLEAEAHKLFKGRAGSSIRTSRKHHDDCLKESKDSIIKPEAWEEVQNTIGQKTELLEKLRAEKVRLFNRKSWLERCRDALPMTGRLREGLKQLDGLPEIPDLSESFGEDIKQARSAWQNTKKLIQSTENQLQGLRVEAHACQLAPEVIIKEVEIDRLHTSIGVYRAQKQHLAKIKAEAEQTKLRLEIACRDLEIDTSLAGLEVHRVSQVKFLEAQQGAKTLAAAEEDLSSAQKTADELQKEIGESGKANTLSDFGDIKVLEHVESGTKQYEEVAKGLETRVSAAKDLLRKVEGLQSRLLGSPKDLEQTRKLQLPLKSTIDQFREHFEDLKRRSADLEKIRSEEQGKADKVTAEIERFTRQRDLPSLEDLSLARSHRDHGWSLVLEDWKGGGTKEEFEVGLPLEKAYPDAVAAADAVADRLRTDAEDVAQMEEKRFLLISAKNTLVDTLEQQNQLAGKRSTLEAEWKKAWMPCNLEPLSPREMSEWRENWEDFCEQWDQWSGDTERILHDQDDVSKAVIALKKATSVEIDYLPDLLSAARKKITAYNQSVGYALAEAKQLAFKEKKLKEVTGKLPELQAAATDAQTTWDTCRVALSLPESLHASKAVDLLRTRKDIFVEYDGWCLLIEEMEGLEASISEYEVALSSLISQLNLDSRGAENDEAALWKLLDQAKKSQSDFNIFQGQIRGKEVEMSEMRQQEEQSRAAFDAMLATALLDSADTLDEFLQHFEKKREIFHQVRTSRESLASFARNESVEGFIERLEQENVVELDGSLISIEEQIPELELQIETTINELQELLNQRGIMESASDESAKQAQLAELAAARIQQDAERFVRLQLAITILKSRIDLFREQNQGPFMERASHWFSEITGGDFSGIATSYDAGDKPVIGGQRAVNRMNRTVPISGMSEGTRDQLFLALRLAGLELHLTDHEPMPLILDDLLVHFDDGRALRALIALRSFGQHSQVLLFTHHEHLVRLAESAWGKGSFHFHQLSRSNEW